MRYTVHMVAFYIEKYVIPAWLAKQSLDQLG